jgi:hypothetical protein
MSIQKKTLILPLFDKEVAVDVDFHFIQVVETVYGLSADAVIALLSDSGKAQRHKIAEVVAGWLASKNLGFKRSEILQHVATSKPDLLALYVANVYGALLFVLNFFDRNDPEANERKFDELVASDKWPKRKEQREGQERPKAKTKRRPELTKDAQ